MGHRLRKNEFLPTENKQNIIHNLPLPNTKHELRRNIGLFGFFRQFHRGAAEDMAPLNDILKGAVRKNDKTKINWTPELEKCFQNCKEKLANATALNYPKKDAKLILTT